MRNYSSTAIFISILILLVIVSQSKDCFVQSVCCHAQPRVVCPNGTVIENACLDCFQPVELLTRHCGVGRCNFYGCDCVGGCRRPGLIVVSNNNVPEEEEEEDEPKETVKEESNQNVPVSNQSSSSTTIAPTTTTVPTTMAITTTVPTTTTTTTSTTTVNSSPDYVEDPQVTPHTMASMQNNSSSFHYYVPKSHSFCRCKCVQIP